MSPDPESLLPAASIQVLPEGIANRIAAGEVVERPASVVKELIENSLDAEASEITVSVHKAGFEELLVSDDGWGMNADDVLLAFRRHATSKISSAEDLQCITHLGFRGEALPSVASVSRVEVISRREDSNEGVKYNVDGGKSGSPEPASRDRGTTIRVRSLFYNVPARRKFLRTPATEYGHILNSFKQYAIAYPALHWTLLKDGDLVWDLPPTELAQRIGQLFGVESEDDLHNINGRSGDIFVSGVVGGSSLFKKSRGDQYFYVNRRPIKSSSLHHAVVNGFGPLIQSPQVPFYAIYLRTNPEDFDVNVHPAKHEIRFRDEGSAYRAVLVSVRDALGQTIRDGNTPVNVPLGTGRDSKHRSQIGSFPRAPRGKAVDGVEELELLFGRPPRSKSDFSPSGRIPEPPAGPGAGNQPEFPVVTGDNKSADSRTSASRGHSTGTGYDPHGQDQTPRQDTQPQYFVHERTAPAGDDQQALRTNVWQLHRTYIMSQVKSGLVIIDQHVAHERILYEKALAAIRERPWNGQQLLFPVKVNLDLSDSALLEELAPKLVKIGFDLEHFGGSDWVIRSLPAGLKIKSEEELLRDIISDYKQEHTVRLEPEESLAASFACKAAIKAGDPLNLDEMNILIDELFQTEYPFVCPHGRPIVINLTILELHKLFGRE